MEMCWECEGNRKIASRSEYLLFLAHFSFSLQRFDLAQNRPKKKRISVDHTRTMSRKFAFTFTADFSSEPLSHHHRELKLIMMFFLYFGEVQLNSRQLKNRRRHSKLNHNGAATMMSNVLGFRAKVLKIVPKTHEAAENEKWEESTGNSRQSSQPSSHTVRALSHQPSIFAHVCMKCSRASSCLPTAATRHRGLPAKNRLNLHSTHSQ